MQPVFYCNYSLFMPLRKLRCYMGLYLLIQIIKKICAMQHSFDNCDFIINLLIKTIGTKPGHNC
jgi:hypothetical protein